MSGIVLKPEDGGDDIIIPSSGEKIVIGRGPFLQVID
jgi:hypothetical protein